MLSFRNVRTIYVDKFSKSRFIEYILGGLMYKYFKIGTHLKLIFSIPEQNVDKDISKAFGTSVRRSSGRRSGVAVRAVDCWQ